MNNERFTKHYIDIINSTLSDTVLRNITMQANAQYVDELVGGLNAENDGLKQQILEMDSIIKKVVSERDNFSEDCRKEVEELNKSKQEVNNIRHQASQVETFRNQLVESQKTIEKQNSEIEELNNSKNFEIETLKKIIEDLQAPPKRKKTPVLNKVIEIEPELTPNSIIEDGGTF